MINHGSLTTLSPAPPPAENHLWYTWSPPAENQLWYTWPPMINHTTRCSIECLKKILNSFGRFRFRLTWQVCFEKGAKFVIQKLKFFIVHIFLFFPNSKQWKRYGDSEDHVLTFFRRKKIKIIISALQNSKRKKFVSSFFIYKKSKTTFYFQMEYMTWICFKL